MFPGKTLTKALTINPEVGSSYLNSPIGIIFWNLFRKQKKYSPIPYDSLSVSREFPVVFGQI